MKAQRRHELKTNTLDAKLKNAPAFFQQHSSRILLGLTLCVLAFVLVRYYLNNKAENAQKLGESMGDAIFTLGEMKKLAENGDVRSFSSRLDQVDAIVSTVLESSEDPKVRATALVVRGDANWAAANFPALPGATTQPELKLHKPSEQYLKASEEAYNKVVEPPLDTDAASVTSARLGLAAIAENRRQFDKAREQYQKIIANPATDKTYSSVAKRRMEALSTLEKPVFLSQSPAVEPVPDVSPTSHPSTNPSTAPSTQATTHPAVAPR